MLDWDDGGSRPNLCQNVCVHRDDLAETVAVFQAAGFTVLRHPSPAHLGSFSPPPDCFVIAVRADYDGPCGPGVIEWEAEMRARADDVLDQCVAARQGIGYIDNDEQ